ncbi:MAG: Asp-tRNA(Asn)/Glu-tRNA(Gln) amidotransferase subunit GatA [Nitrospinota bacterium]
MSESVTLKDLRFNPEHENLQTRDALNRFCIRQGETMENLNAFVTQTDSAKVLEAAQKSDKEGDSPNRGKLSGLPISVKDNISTEGQRTTCASKMLDSYIPKFDATVVRKLKEAGAIIVGKTNLDEFAMGNANENSAFGPVLNPWNREHVPGGSSGGAAVSVAAGMSVGALGSDTGGSIRQPAAFCGVVGMKPTYGLVSRFGLIAFASSLDQIGPITNNVRDNATLLGAIAGYDPLDSTSAKVEVPDFEAGLGRDISGMRVGIPRECFSDLLDPEIKKSVENSIAVLKSLGVSVEEVSLSTLEFAVPAYYVIAPCEASSNLARFDGVRYGLRAQGAVSLTGMYKQTRCQGFGKEVKMRIMLGTYALSSGYYDAYYLKALKVRNLIKKEFSMLFKNLDALVTPVTPTLPFKIGEKPKNTWERYLADIYTVSVNLAGLPALSLPCGSSGGLPIGFQIIGDHFTEQGIYDIAFKLEEALSLEKPLPVADSQSRENS